MKSIRNQLYRLLTIVIVPLCIVLSLLVVMLFVINNQFAKALTSAETAAEFNNEFKDNLDLAMWYHVIGANTEEELPMDEVEHAEQVILRLRETTSLRGNEWRIDSMLNMCENLKKYMIDIANTKSYDERMGKLERDVYTITELIETYMHDYIYDEVKNLASIRADLSKRIRIISVSLILAFIILLVAIAAIVLRFTARITQPLAELVVKAEKLAEGDFSVREITANSREIRLLDDGFNNMTRRINEYLSLELKTRDALRRTEFELFQAQINPHFLYNTLDSIIWLAEAGRNEDVVNMASSLSIFFRNSLNRGNDIISLSDEIKQVTSYLEIQSFRYSDILTYDIDIPNDLLHCEMPKLTLQPLVENAIYHGIKNKRGTGKISIKGKDDGDNILLTVEDDGAGISAERLDKLRQGVYGDNHTGLGLINVHKRIKLYCGEQYGLIFESVEQQGTTVAVCLPKNIENNLENNIKTI